MVDKVGLLVLSSVGKSSVLANVLTVLGDVLTQVGRGVNLGAVAHVEVRFRQAQLLGCHERGVGLFHVTEALVN